MKVVFVFGGIPHYYNKILNLLNSQENYEITVITPSKKGQTIGAGVYQTEEGITFNRIDLEEYTTWYGKPFFKRFYDTLDEINPDIVVSGWPYFIHYILSAKRISRLKAKGVKFVAKEIPFSVPKLSDTLKTFNKNTSLDQRMERIYTNILYFKIVKWIRLKLYSHVIDAAVVYVKKGKTILSSYGLDKKKIVVTYNSIVTEDIFDTIQGLEKNGINRSDLYQPKNLIHVGRLVKWKRVDLLIDAVKNLTASFDDVTLTVVGDGPEKKALEQHAKKNGIAERVNFVGAIYDDHELAKLFLKAHIYVLAGMGGLSINEAMCYGLPVICSICDGTEKHLVFEGVNGSYFESDDLQSLTKVIGILLKDESKCDLMGIESIRIVKQEINEKVVVNKYIECFSMLKSN